MFTSSNAKIIPENMGRRQDASLGDLNHGYTGRALVWYINFWVIMGRKTLMGLLSS